MNFQRGQDPKTALVIGLDSLIIKYLKQSDPEYRKTKLRSYKWSLGNQVDAFYAFHRIVNDAANFKEGPIEEYMKMLLHILRKYPYSVLAKGKKKKYHGEIVVEQGDINYAGANILTLFLDYPDVSEVQELFRRTVKTIRMSNLRTGQKTKLLKVFRDEYIKNLPDEF